MKKLMLIITILCFSASLSDAMDNMDSNVKPKKKSGGQRKRAGSSQVEPEEKGQSGQTLSADTILEEHDEGVPAGGTVGVKRQEQDEPSAERGGGGIVDPITTTVIADQQQDSHGLGDGVGVEQQGTVSGVSGNEEGKASVDVRDLVDRKDGEARGVVQQPEVTQERLSLLNVCGDALWGGISTAFNEAFSLTAGALSGAYQMSSDAIFYAIEETDKKMPLVWDLSYAEICLSQHQYHFLKQYLDFCLETLGDDNAFDWIIKKANLGHTLCLYEATRHFAQEIKGKRIATRKDLKQYHLNLLVLFVFRLAIDAIKTKVIVLDGFILIQELLGKIEHLFNNSLCVFSANPELFVNAKEFIQRWLEAETSKNLPSFTQTFVMQIRKSTGGLYCSKIDPARSRTLQHLDGEMKKHQKEIITFVNDAFKKADSLEALFEWAKTMMDGDGVTVLIEGFTPS